MNAPTFQENNARRAKILVQEGQLSRAAQALVSLGMVWDSKGALLKMLDKPQCRAYQDPGGGP